MGLSHKKQDQYTKIIDQIVEKQSKWSKIYQKKPR